MPYSIADATRQPEYQQGAGERTDAGQRRVPQDALVWVPIYLINGANIANTNFNIVYDNTVARPEGDLVALERGVGEDLEAAGAVVGAGLFGGKLLDLGGQRVALLPVVLALPRRVVGGVGAGLFLAPPAPEEPPVETALDRVAPEDGEGHDGGIAQATGRGGHGVGEAQDPQGQVFREPAALHGDGDEKAAQQQIDVLVAVADGGGPRQSSWQQFDALPIRKPRHHRSAVANQLKPG